MFNCYNSNQFSIAYSKHVKDLTNYNNQKSIIIDIFINDRR